MDDLFTNPPEQPARKQYDFFNLHAREKMGLPDEWEWFKLEAKGEHGSPSAFVIVTGAVCTAVYEKGKYKGRKNWKLLDKETEIPVAIRNSEHDAWLLSWERRTGECYKCEGNGQQLWGWSKDHGNKFRPCKRCGATGLAPSVSDRSAEGDETEGLGPQGESATRDSGGRP